jgi:transposase
VGVSIRKTRTASNATAVQVVRYERRRVVVLKHIGSAHREEETLVLVNKAREWIAWSTLQVPLFSNGANDMVAKSALRLTGTSHRFTYAALTAYAQRCGFNALEDTLLLDLAIMRLVEPTSKLRAIALLDQYFGVRHAERTLYRSIPKMHAHKEQAQRIAVAYAKDVLSCDLSLVLYDVTTLYFESFKADELRVPGFSKDGKPQQPQLVLGLLVTREGFPLGYELFPGNTFEGKTMLPVLGAFAKAHHVTTPTVVADAAMLSVKVIEELMGLGLSYIVGARLANAPPKVIERIASELGQQEGLPVRMATKHGDLVCAFSGKRYRKDKAAFELQIKKAQALVAKGEPGRRAKFVSSAKGKDPYVLDTALMAKTERLLGIKGYCTNIPRQQLSDNDLIARYHDLWHVEQAFRMAKSDLAARPIFHHTQSAVRAHLLICFVALVLGRAIELACGRSLRSAMDALWKVSDGELLDTTTGEVFTLREEIPQETKDLLNALGLSY